MPHFLVKLKRESIIFQKALYIELKNKRLSIVCKGQLYYKKAGAEVRRLGVFFIQVLGTECPEIKGVESNISLGIL